MKKIKVCVNTIGFISFFLMIGCVGGMENDALSLLDGTILFFIFLAFVGLSASASNVLDGLEKQPRKRKHRKQHMEQVVTSDKVIVVFDKVI